VARKLISDARKESVVVSFSNVLAQISLVATKILDSVPNTTVIGGSNAYFLLIVEREVAHLSAVLFQRNKTTLLKLQLFDQFGGHSTPWV
jgi:hypothetical protein